VLRKFRRNCLIIVFILILTFFLIIYSNNTALASNFSSISELPQISQNPITDSGIDVNNFPVGIAVNPTANKIYVTNEYSNTVSVIEGHNDTVEATILVDSLPYDLDVDPFTNKVYVTNLGSDTVSIIDGDTNQIVGVIRNITTPVGLDVDSVNGYIYVTSIDTDTVYKIDAVTNKVINATKVGKDPYTVDIKPGKTYKVYVSNLGSDTVSVIDGRSFALLKNITVGDLPVGLAANPSNEKVYVANRGSDRVSVIDAVSDTIVKNLKVGHQPDGVDINFSTNMVYATNTGSSTVSVIDPEIDEIVTEIKVNNNLSPELTQVQVLPPTIEFPNVASFVDVNRATNMVYVTNTGSSTVSVINGTSNKLLVGSTFNVAPLNSGKIKCANMQDKNDVLDFSASQYVRLEYEKKYDCTAYPYSGNKFSFWSDSQEGNTTPSILPSDPLNWIIDWFRGFISPQASPIKEFTASEYNKVLTANFTAGPDYVAALVAPLILTAATAVITAIIIGLRWAFRRLGRKFNEKNYMKRHFKTIEDAYGERGRSKEEAFQSLIQIRKEIRRDFYTGNLYDKDYQELVEVIGRRLESLR
jgi:YVTN family beta-propeller protein